MANNNSTRTNKAKELLNEKKNTPSKNMKYKIPELEIAEHLVREVMLGKLPGVILRSEGGLGKTHLTKTLAEEICPKNYVYIAGHVTPLKGFQIIHDNRGKILIFDDIEESFKDDAFIGIMRAVTWEVDGKREVTWGTTSKKLGDYPSSFEFKGGIILLCNKIPREKDAGVKALVTRMPVHDIKLTYKKRLRIMLDFIEYASWKHIIGRELDEDEKEELKTEFRNNASVLYENFNFRTLQQYVIHKLYGEEYYPDKPNLAKELIDGTHKKSSDKTVVLETILKKMSSKDARDYFMSETRKSEKTFYRVKKVLMEELELDKKSKKKKIVNSHEKKVQQKPTIPEKADLILSETELEPDDSMWDV